VLKNLNNLLICLLLAGVAGCNHESEPKPLWTDDTDPRIEKDVSVFESAFVLEPTCHGLHFKRKSLVPAPKKYWEVVYDDLGGGGRDKFFVMEPKGFEAASVHFLAADAKEAASKACFVAKGQGGSR
jgi:hypothetical protein